MLKSFFQAPLSSVTAFPVCGSLSGESSEGDQTKSQLNSQSISGSSSMSTPQPIGDADKQRFVKLSDAQGKAHNSVYVSNWYDCHLSISHYRESFPANRKATWVTSTESSYKNSQENNQNIASYEATDRSLAEQVQQLTQYIERQQQLHLVERKLRRTLNFSAIMGTTVVETAALLDAYQVSLLRYDSELKTHSQVVRYCQNQALAWKSEISLSRSEFPSVFRQLCRGDVVNISSTSQEIVGESRQWLARWPGNWLLVPVRKRISALELAESSCDCTTDIDISRYWGVIVLAKSEAETWDQGDIEAVRSITVELSLALDQSKQHQELLVANQELQKLALSDGLTSLANRRRFDEHLADEWQRLARDKQPLSLILCDLDHFKRYNDTFGHPAGDRCLIRVARALLSGPQRPADLVARYGGEEFAIILPNTDTHGAWRIAQKIHKSIRALRIEHAPGNEEPYVTVTMGVSTVIPGHDNTAQMLVQASDLALYHAKQQGRNRTYVNGHYNTVNTSATKATTENETKLDMMLLDG